uniref:39S ribosomal protein L55, mitochondrial n=1 Tax=Salvator merianae TaxID=96440 RepID=A0A8D0DTZ8_SALMN
MAAISWSLSFRLTALKTFFGLHPRCCGLHTSASQLNSNRTSIACYPRHKYARLYPVLLVRPDGSSIHIRYREPRQILLMPIDVSALSEAEKKAWMRRRGVIKAKPKADIVFEDEFSLDDYRKFWKKK